MSKHTPGPWKIKGRIGEDHLVSVELMCINGLKAWFGVARVYCADESTDGYTDGVFDQHAADGNAHLIAAAPELLGACRSMLSELDALERTGGPCIPSLGACDAMRTAIAKAEGRS